MYVKLYIFVITPTAQDKVQAWGNVLLKIFTEVTIIHKIFGQNIMNVSDAKERLNLFQYQISYK